MNVRVLDSALEQPAPVRDQPLLSVRDIVQEFTLRGAGGVKGGVVRAVSGVSFDLWPGETLAVVGETGSGKSTLARAVIQSPRPKSGSVTFRGAELTDLRGRRRLTAARRGMQYVYQDPSTSLNPRWRVEDVVAEPLRADGELRGARLSSRVAELLDMVGLDPRTYAKRRPSELSGGQAQRVAIARAVALAPALVICDEAVSSLDVLIQAQILNLFERLRSELGLAYLFIAHDLALVRQVSDRVAVMHLGQIVELGPVTDVFDTPMHPYTAALIDSVPRLDPEGGVGRKPRPIAGEPPSPIDPPSGCRFRTRCPFAQPVCAEEKPPLHELLPNRQVACHFPLAGATQSAGGTEDSVR